MIYLFIEIKYLIEEVVFVIGIIKGKKGIDYQIKFDVLYFIRFEDLYFEAIRCDLIFWIFLSNCYIVYQLFIFVLKFVKMGNM